MALVGFQWRFVFLPFCKTFLVAKSGWFFFNVELFTFGIRIMSMKGCFCFLLSYYSDDVVATYFIVIFFSNLDDPMNHRKKSLAFFNSQLWSCQVLRGPGEYALNNNETGPLGKATWLDHIGSYLMLVAGLKHMVDAG